MRVYRPERTVAAEATRRDLAVRSRLVTASSARLPSAATIGRLRPRLPPRPGAGPCCSLCARPSSDVGALTEATADEVAMMRWLRHDVGAPGTAVTYCRGCKEGVLDPERAGWELAKSDR